MKVNELFEEERLKYFDYKEDELIETIKKECSEILNIYKSTGNFLYRGEKDAKIRQIFKASIHQDRIPVQMDKAIHDYFNETLKRLGFIAHRGNSIFVTGEKYDASDWGELFIVFPINKFDYTWFDYDQHWYVYNDIVIFAERRQFRLAYNRMKEWGLEKIKERLPLEMVESAEKETLKTYVMHGFNPDGSIKPYEDIKEKIWEDFITLKLNARKDHLKKAVSNKKEVLIANCQYYGVPQDSTILKKLMSEK